MLKKAKKSDIDLYADLFFKIASDKENSSYPTYTDGIKTKDSFINNLKSAIDDPFGECLLYEYESKVYGVVSFFYEPDGSLLELCAFDVAFNKIKAMEELIDLINGLCFDRSLKLPIYFGFPEENKGICSYLLENGFEIIEKSGNFSFFFDEYKRKRNETDSRFIKMIGNENYSDFEKIHDPLCDVTFFWNSDRIKESLDSWAIFAYYGENNEVSACVYANYQNGFMEIFGFDFLNGIFDEEVYKSLLKKLLDFGKESGIKNLTYFANETVNKKFLEDMGFLYIGDYLCFYKQ